MIKVLVVVVLGAFFSIASADGEVAMYYEGGYKVLGFGATSCHEVLENHEKEGFVFVAEIWLSGYFSAVNNLLRDGGIEFELSDVEDVLGYVERYCVDPEKRSVHLEYVVDQYWRDSVKKRFGKKGQK